MNEILHIIAGSESTGSAGVQTDIKTAQAIRVYSSSSITCLVSYDPSNDLAHIFHPIEPTILKEQIKSTQYVLEPATLKIGMLGTIENVKVVSEAIDNYHYNNIILDPVLVCKGTDTNGELDDAFSIDDAIIEWLLPKSNIVTPNLIEAQILSGIKIDSKEDMLTAAKKIAELGPTVVVVKGGTRLSGLSATDLVYSKTTGEHTYIENAKVDSVISGAGCTFAAATASYIAKGFTPIDASMAANKFVNTAIKNALKTKAPFLAIKQS
jgi:pyridoxine kinase